MNLVEIKHLNKRYGNVSALDDVNLTIGAGKIIGLLGSNGSGKSTLIKCINKLTTPSSGSITVLGKELGVESKSIISYLPERTYFNPNLKVNEAIDYFKDFYEDFDEAKARSMIDTLKIDSTKKFRVLSKGTREKIQLVLVMSRNAKLYILDEPIGGVDPASRDFILKLILNNLNEGATLLISTHLIADIESILDEVIMINEGKLELQQSADSLRDEHQMSIDQLFREVYRC